MRIEVSALSNDQIKNKTKVLENDTSSMKSEINRHKREMSSVYYLYRKL
jgi:hypothetical protein